MLYPALCLVACSGLFFLTCQQQSGNLFVEARGKVLSMINGAMDSSSSFALALYTIYSYAGYKTTFMVFGALSILIVIRTLLFYTKTSIPYERIFIVSKEKFSKVFRPILDLVVPNSKNNPFSSRYHKITKLIHQ